MTRISLPLLMPARGCNCQVCPFFVDNPAAVEPVCSGQNSDCSYCGCARTADLSGGPGGCGECPIRCGSRVDIGAWMTDVGNTLEFDDIGMRGQTWPGLPRFVPQLDTANVADLDDGLAWPAYAVGLRRVFSPVTSTLLPTFRGTTAREAIGLDDRQRSVLVGYGEDPLVEAFWSRRHGLYEGLVEQAWDLVLAPNFSMYGNQPRTEHLLNFRRNLLICEEMLAAGINAAPNLYWYRLEDLERYGRWLEEVTPAIVAMNLQTFRTDVDWSDMALPGLSWLAAVLPATTRLVTVGASRSDRIGQLVDLFGDRVVVVSQNAIQYARHGAVMGPNGREDLHATVPAAFAWSVRYYSSLLEKGPA